MKTAVDFMASELLYLDNEYDMKLINKNEYQAKRKEIIDQAKEMFEEQIMDSYRYGKDNGIDISHTVTKEIPAQQYYNETFKSE
jgi:hypothetical protein